MKDTKKLTFWNMFHFSWILFNMAKVLQNLISPQILTCLTQKWTTFWAANFNGNVQLYECILLHISFYHISHFNSLLCKKIHLGSCNSLHTFLSYLQIGFPWVEEITQLLPLGSSKCTMHCARDVHLVGSLIHSSPYKFCLKNCMQTKCTNMTTEINILPLGNITLMSKMQVHCGN